VDVDPPLPHQARPGPRIISIGGLTEPVPRWGLPERPLDDLTFSFEDPASSENPAIDPAIAPSFLEGPGETASRMLRRRALVDERNLREALSSTPELDDVR
jgi:hypothetical protein